MRKSENVEATSNLQEVVSRFEAWRKTKEHGSTPIPEILWEQAVQLTETHSIHQVCKALRLDFNRLKRRVHSRRSIPQSGANSPAAFVELSMPGILSAPECSIRLDRPDGASIHMHVKGAVDPQLIEIAMSFWSCP